MVFIQEYKIYPYYLLLLHFLMLYLRIKSDNYRSNHFQNCNRFFARNSVNSLSSSLSPAVRILVSWTSKDSNNGQIETNSEIDFQISM